MKSQTSSTQRHRRDQRPNDAQRPRAHRARAVSEEAVVAAFKEGIAVAAIARRAGKTPRAIEWTLRKVGLRTNPHKRPSAAEPGDASAHDQATSFRNQDTVFQRAMSRAIASGDEHPPMVGIHRDPRPLNARIVFEPVPHSSGCTSPARECADLVSPVDRLGRLARGQARISEPSTAAEMGNVELG
jgi:hypothetical protein